MSEVNQPDEIEESYYPDDNEPYSIQDIGYGTCSECGSGLENWGAVSDGDGDLYDELGCPLCQESRGKANEIWLDDDDGWLDVEDTFESAVNQPPTLADDIPF